MAYGRSLLSWKILEKTILPNFENKDFNSLPFIYSFGIFLI